MSRIRVAEQAEYRERSLRIVQLLDEKHVDRNALRERFGISRTQLEHMIELGRKLRQEQNESA